MERTINDLENIYDWLRHNDAFTNAEWATIANLHQEFLGQYVGCFSCGGQGRKAKYDLQAHLSCLIENRRIKEVTNVNTTEITENTEIFTNVKNEQTEIVTNVKIEDDNSNINNSNISSNKRKNKRTILEKAQLRTKKYTK